MATETSEDLVKRLMSEIRAHGKAMEAASNSATSYERRDSGPGREEVRDVDIYDNNATFVIRKPVDRKSDHTFLTLNSSDLVNGKISTSSYHHHNHHLPQQTPVLSTFLSHPSTTTAISSSFGSNKFNGSTPISTTTTTKAAKSTSLINRPYAQQIPATLTAVATPTTPIVYNGNLIKGESDVSCYSSISSTAAAAVDPVTVPRSNRSKHGLTANDKLMCNQSDPQCPSCGITFSNNSDSDPNNSSEPYMISNGVSIKSPIVSNRSPNDRFHSSSHGQHQHGQHNLVKCDHAGPVLNSSSSEDPPRYSPCRFYNGNGSNNVHHNHSHSHSYYCQNNTERLGPKVAIPLTKPQLLGKSPVKGMKHDKTKHPLKYIKKVQRCPGCSGKCYLEPLPRSVHQLSLSSGENLFTLYCPTCSKSGLTRVVRGGPGENGNYILNGSMDKHLTYYSALPRLWDIDMWHKKRKRASIRKNEKILIVFTSIVSMVIFMTLTYLGVTTFQKITELPKIG